MKCAWMFLASLLYAATLKLHDVNCFSSDDLDIARDAMQFEALKIVAKDSRPKRVSLKSFSKVLGGKGITTASVRHRIFLRKGAKGMKGKKASVRKVSTTKPRNLNKFYEAMDQVERAIAQAQLSRRPVRIEKLRSQIKKAVALGNVRFARRALGIALYATTRKSTRRRGRGKRAAKYDAKRFMANVRKDLGEVKFSNFLALQGDVTLMFAVDITYSMYDDIQAAKDIIQEIGDHDRTEPVNYILSTFGDPIDQGKTTHFADDKIDLFRKSVQNLKVFGGADCPEYTFQGMINALYEDPRWGSPLYVFTDAIPKDADEANNETFRLLADDLGITVNFFSGKTFCTAGPTSGTTYKEKEFKDLVEYYGGQYLKIDAAELKKLGGFTGSGLDGTTAVVSGKSKTSRRKTRATSWIGIPVDETVTKLVVTVTTEKSANAVQLRTPAGSIQTAGRTLLTRVIVFNINSPARGLWKLRIPSSVGKYEFSAKVSSPENIDFEHTFRKIDRRKVFYLRSPLIGQKNQVSLTVSGANKIQKSSLSVDVIDLAGNTLAANIKVSPFGKSGYRFIFTFTPPNKVFRLLLKGKTRRGKNFQRISRHANAAKPLVLKEYYTAKHYTMKRTDRQTFIMFYLFNGSNQKKDFSVSFKVRKGYTVTWRPKRQSIRPQSKKILRVFVKRVASEPAAAVGETLNVVVIVKGKDFVTSELVPLMIV